MCRNVSMVLLNNVGCCNGVKWFMFCSNINCVLGMVCVRYCVCLGWMNLLCLFCMMVIGIWVVVSFLVVVFGCVCIILVIVVMNVLKLWGVDDSVV